MKRWQIRIPVFVTDVAEYDKALAGDMLADGPRHDDLRIIVSAPTAASAVGILAERLSDHSGSEGSNG